MTLADLLARAVPRLPGESPRLDAQLLLARALARPRTWLLAYPEYVPTPAESRAFDALLARAAAGEPIPYLVGEREFCTLAFAVTPDVLIPRPETELLVERAIARLQTSRVLRSTPEAQRSGVKTREVSATAADVGTGCGCTAIALARHCPGLRVFATDISPSALAVARQNAAAHGVSDRTTFLEGDLLDPLPGPVDLICANLPYIPTATLDGLPVSRTEPRLALDGGPDGLALIRRLLAQALPKLAPGGAILFEIEASQGPAALGLARATFPAARVALHRDLAGLDRLVEVPAGRNPAAGIRIWPGEPDKSGCEWRAPPPTPFFRFFLV